MKPDWDKLMDEYKDSTTSLVADVDCTAAGKPLCDANGVQGFPTIKYGNPNDLQKYEGGRSFDDLKAFASENLGPTCGPSNMDLCDDAMKAKIEELKAMGAEALGKLVDEKTKEIEEHETNFKSDVAILQARYQELSNEKDAAIKAIKDSGLGLMKSVRAHVHGSKTPMGSTAGVSLPTSFPIIAGVDLNDSQMQAMVALVVVAALIVLKGFCFSSNDAAPKHKAAVGGKKSKKKARKSK
jgi:hypothetical protein